MGTAKERKVKSRKCATWGQRDREVENRMFANNSLLGGGRRHLADAHLMELISLVTLTSKKEGGRGSESLLQNVDLFRGVLLAVSEISGEKLAQGRLRKVLLWRFLHHFECECSSVLILTCFFVFVFFWSCLLFFSAVRMNC